MPLSEDEQRILHQIEQQFYESDPAFARGVSETTLYRHAFRNIKLASLGLIAGLAFLIATLPVNVWVSFLGFVAMLGAAFVIENNARKLGRVGWQHVTSTVRSGRLKESLTGGDRMKRFQKPE